MAMTPAGKRDKKITFKRNVTSENGFGEPVRAGDPTILGSEMAQVNYGRGEERRGAAITGGKQSAVFRVLSNSMTRAVEIRDFIEMDGVPWDIGSIADWGRLEIDFTAVRRR